MIEDLTFDDSDDANFNSFSKSMGKTLPADLIGPKIGTVK